MVDTPELFWSEASLYPLYEAIREYLEIGPRAQVLNDRLAVAGDLVSSGNRGERSVLMNSLRLFTSISKSEEQIGSPGSSSG
jgi:uncharacterized Rmd1/YagE family protein